MAEMCPDVVRCRQERCLRLPGDNGDPCSTRHKWNRNTTEISPCSERTWVRRNYEKAKKYLDNNLIYIMQYNMWYNYIYIHSIKSIHMYSCVCIYIYVYLYMYNYICVYIYMRSTCNMKPISGHINRKLQLPARWNRHSQCHRSG